MRAFILTIILAACDPAGRAAGPPVAITGIHPDASTGDVSTGDQPRLDLGGYPPIPDLPTAESSSSETTGGDTPTTSDTSTGGEDSAGPVGTTSGTSTGGETSTGEESSSGDASSSGDPPAGVCEDGVCDPAERAPCWGPGWCLPDCVGDAACLSDCPCTDGAAAVKNFCKADPPPACSATAPGGYCDPDGDGSPDDADTTRGFYEWLAKCG